MNNILIGKQIAKIRKEKNLTQKNLAEKLYVTEQAVSKWERGLGLPDIETLKNLANILNINIEEILSGETKVGKNNSGNMLKANFYVCPKCANVIASISDLNLTCCGSSLEKEKAKNGDSIINISNVEDEIFVEINHEMSKIKYISFVAYVTDDKIYINKLYKEQQPEVRFRRMGNGYIVAFSNKDGLFIKKV